MAGQLIIPGFMPAADSDGGRLSGSRITVFANLTTTLASLFYDIGLTVAAPNPVVADAGGQFVPTFADETLLYSVKVTDAAGDQLFQQDNLTLISGPNARPNLSNVSSSRLTPSGGVVSGAVPVPAYLDRLARPRPVTDWIDKSYWPNIRNDVSVPVSVFDSAMTYAVADLPNVSTASAYVGQVKIPEGRFPFTANFFTRGVRVVGEGKGSRLDCQLMTGTPLTVGSYYCALADLDMITTVTRSIADYAIVVPVGQAFFDLDNVTFGRFPSVLRLASTATLTDTVAWITVNNITVRDITIPGGTMIRIESGAGLNFTALKLFGTTGPTTSPAAGILATSFGDLKIGAGSEIIGCTNNVLLAPPTGRNCDSFVAVQVNSDTPYGTGWLFKPSGGVITDARLIGCWGSSSQVSHGLVADTTSGGTIDGLTLSEHTAILNNQNGVYLNMGAAGSIKGFRWKGGGAAANASGFATAGNIDGFDVDAVLGPTRGQPGNVYGAFIGGSGSDHFRLAGDYRGNTTSNLTNSAGTSATKVVSAWTS